MAFDPNLPQANAPIVSGELRAQFNGLKELVDGLPSSPGMLSALQANTAGNVDSAAVGGRRGRGLTLRRKDAKPC